MSSGAELDLTLDPEAYAAARAEQWALKVNRNPVLTLEDARSRAVAQWANGVDDFEVAAQPRIRQLLLGSGRIVSLAKRTAPVSISDPTVTETDLIAATVPADSLGLDGWLRARLAGFFAVANSTGEVTFRVHYGAVELLALVLDVTTLNIATYRWGVDLALGNLITTALQGGAMRMDFVETEGFGSPLVALPSVFGTANSEDELSLRVTAQFDGSIDGTFNCSFGTVELARTEG